MQPIHIFSRSRQEIDREIKSMKELTRKNTQTREDALAFLVRAGIATKSGRLAKRYRSK